ncbi:MAG: hypothetical protein AB1640_12510 [bacterium]
MRLDRRVIRRIGAGSWLAVLLPWLFGCAATLPPQACAVPGMQIHTASSPAATREIRDDAQRYLAGLEDYLRVRARPVDMLRVVHFRSRWDLWGYLSRESPPYRWRRGACFETPDGLTLAVSGNPGSKEFHRLLRHELTHAFLASRYRDFPPWIDEGLAQVLSAGPPFPRPGSSPPHPVESDRCERLPNGCLELLAAPPGEKLTRAQCRQASALTAALIARSDDALSRLERFLEISSSQRDPAEAFKDAWGLPFEQACVLDRS